ncbi:MAG: nuclear transport factor 2 family protein [Chitinophagaceae bacterium]
MKTIQALFFLFFLFISVNVFSQATETSPQKIRRLENMERTAIMNRDTAMLFKLWSEDYVVNNPNNMILTAGQIKAFIRSGGIDSSSFTRSIEKMVFIKDVAIVMGTEIMLPKNKSDNGGKNTTRRYTNIWIKSDTSWQLSARQASNITVQ